MHPIYTIDGKEVPSVTTILKLISTNEDLMRWANSMGFRRKDIRKIQEESTTFGTTVHAHLQHLVDPKAEVEIPPYQNPVEEFEIQTMLRQFKAVLSPYPYETIRTELSHTSKTLGYGGTCDWLFSLPEETSAQTILADFKTSKKVYPTHFLQLGGYYNLMTELGYQIDFGLIIIVNRRSGCSLHPLSKETLVACADTFQLLYELYLRLQDPLCFSVSYETLSSLSSTKTAF